MPAIPNTLTGAAGEHLVAAHLSIRGYSVGLTRGGSRAVDILASNFDGSISVAIQVKASSTAREERKKKIERSHWTFMLSTADIQNKMGSLIYVFVSLQGQSVDQADYFIIPGNMVSSRLEEKYSSKERKSSIRMLNIFDHEKGDFHNRWDIIDAALTPNHKIG
jgi:Holliday junction resolvase-like predicted endonuclease